MKLPRCSLCQLPVLELEGQFSKLDSLFINSGKPPPETAGWWHARCLAEADVAPLWCDARLHNYREVRHFQEVAVTPDWTVMRDPNRGRLLGFGRHGALLSLSRGHRGDARAVSGGSIFPKIDEAFHLELDDEGLVQTIKDGLVSNGSFALPAVLDRMGIADRTVHPEALEGGVFRFDKELQEYWGRHSVSAGAEYGVFVPSELEPHVGEFLR